MNKKLSFFRYFAYSLLIILLLVLQSTPKLFPEVFGSKPLLLVVFSLCIASKEDKIPSIIFGAVCGMFTDIATGGNIGFFAILLTLICYAEAHIFSTYFKSSLVSVLIVGIIAIPFLIFSYFLIFTVFAGVSDCWIYFVNHYISRIIYTFMMIIPLFYAHGFLYKNLK